ncbi:ABC transporter ATP-binding protein [Aliihoeflea sp. PC F10.4]
MLLARNLSVSLSDRPILNGIDLDLQRGEVVGLLGPNGAGKSTLMRALCGLLPFAGSVEIDGRALGGISERERARLVAFLPQARTIAWPLSVENVVKLARSPWRGMGGFSAHDEAAIADAMEAMDVADLAKRPVTELSGGEQARVLAARALAQETPLLIADEPVAGLDPAHQMTMMAALRAHAARGKSIFVSLHDLTLAARWCDRVILTNSGRIYAAGRPTDTLTAITLADVFGIEAMISADSCGMVLAPTGLSSLGERTETD